jgi:hypothetical protein
VGLYLLIVAGVIIISLVAISRIPQQEGVCTEINVLGIIFKQCDNGEVTSNLTQIARDTVTNVPSLPGEVSEVREVVAAATSSNVTSNPLNSIVGSWLASDQKAFSASFFFGNDGKYTTIVNINGSWSQPIVGEYNFSLVQQQLSLQPYGSMPVLNNIVETTSDSFTVNDQAGTKIIFARMRT